MDRLFSEAVRSRQRAALLVPIVCAVVVILVEMCTRLPSLANRTHSTAFLDTDRVLLFQVSSRAFFSLAVEKPNVEPMSLT